MKISAKPGMTAFFGAVTAAAVLTACSGGGAPKTTASSGGGGGGGNSGYTFAMITHETPGDTFWDRIKAGANQAAKDTGSTMKYSSDPEAGKQAVLIQNAIDSKVDGIATTLVTPDALMPTIKKATEAGIPVDTFNSGIGVHDDLRQVAVGAQVTALCCLEAHREHQARGRGDDGHDEAPRQARARRRSRRRGLLPLGRLVGVVRLRLRGVDRRGGARHRVLTRRRALRADTIVPRAPVPRRGR